MNTKKIGIVCCSNGLRQSYKEMKSLIEKTLNSIGIQPVFSDCIFEKDAYFSASAKERANALMNLYRDDEITDIFDISGGDLSNGILPYLDYEVIGKSNKCFWGYSDLTTVLNAIYKKTGKYSGLYQIRNILSEYKEQQISDVKELLCAQYICLDKEDCLGAKQLAGKDLRGIVKQEDVADGNSLVQNIFKIQYQFVQGHHMEGIVVGGNIRCFLKLAGTPYMPDFEGKILLLESRSGLIPQMETFLSQLQQLGAFEQIAGILLGTFTQLDEEQSKKIELENEDDEGYYPTMAELLKKYVREDLPVAVTKDIGHGRDSKAIMVGAYHKFGEMNDNLRKSCWMN